jgi:hypothetical protein
VAAAAVDDTSAALSYRGAGWLHQTKRWSAANRTLAQTNTKGDAVTHVFTGSRITWYGRMGPDHGLAAVYVDGKLDRLVNTFSATDIPQVAVYSRVFPRVERHTIEIVATGVVADTAKSVSELEAQGWISIDGLQVERAASRIVGSMPRFGIAYRGLGWRHTPAPVDTATMAITSTSGVTPADVAMSSLGGDRAQYTFTGRAVTWVGRRCPTCGIADVYIDGKLETSVDLFAPTLRAGTMTMETSRQVPVFTRRWAVARRRLIAIVVRPDANPLAKGHAVAIDALYVEP